MKRIISLILLLAIVIVSLFHILPVYAEEEVAGTIQFADRNDNKRIYTNEFFYVAIDINNVNSNDEAKLVLKVPKELSLKVDEIDNIKSEENEQYTIYELDFKNTEDLRQETYVFKANAPTKNLSIEGNLNGQKLIPLLIMQVSQKEEKKTDILLNSGQESKENDFIESEISNIIENSKVTNGMTFDWDLMNEDIDLTTYQEVKTNTPVKLKGKFFDETGRDYYLFFGNTQSGNRFDVKKDDFKKMGMLYADLSTTNLLPLLSPGIIGVTKNRKGSEQKIFSYAFEQAGTGRASASGGGATFDFGEMSTPDGPIETSAKQAVSTGEGYPTETFIVKQLIKENEIISYGFLKKDDSSYLPIRVRGYLSNKKTGRVRYDLKFYNESMKDVYYAPTFGIHIDINSGAKRTRLVSNGKEGIYFSEPTKVPADEYPGRVQLHMSSGYQEENGPTSLKVANLLYLSPLFNLSYWTRLTKNNWIEEKIQGKSHPYEDWDPMKPKDYVYDLANPGLVLRWDPVYVQSHQSGEIAFDLTVDDKGGMTFPEDPPVITVDQKDQEFSGGAFTISGTWSDNDSDLVDLYYSIDNKEKIKFGESLLNPELGEIHAYEHIIPAVELDNQDHTITITAIDIEGNESSTTPIKLTFKKEIQATLKEVVYRKDGSLGNQAVPGEELKFSAELVPLKEETGQYELLEYITILDQNLDEPTDIKIVTGSRETVGTGHFNPKTRKLTAIIHKTPDVAETITLEYLAKVKTTTTLGTKILSETTAEGITSERGILPKLSSNTFETEVIEGVLQFAKSPKNLSFGNDLEIRGTTTEYPVEMKDEDLIIRDDRGNGNSWRVTAKLLAPFQTKENELLGETLFYRSGGREEVIGKDLEAVITKETSLPSIGINISNNWNNRFGLFLSVPGGGAQAKSYHSTIRWSLQDVPDNKT